MKNKPERYMNMVKVGPKGQIVIPKEVREMFNIAPGDLLLLLADASRGIAIQRADFVTEIADAIFEGKGKEIFPNVSEEHLNEIANSIKNNSTDAPERDEE